MEATLQKKPDTQIADRSAFDAARRWAELDIATSRHELFDARARERAACYRRNIENYIGTVSVPVGIAGPLTIHGSAGSREYSIPLATTEAALVASYNRGANVVSAAGGCMVRIVDEGISRTPMFAFDSVVDAAHFSRLVVAQEQRLGEVVASVTRHGSLRNLRTVIEGNHVYLELCFLTGDAAGQNMVTFAAEAICRAILDQSPIQPRYWFLEANLSGDKKATAQSLSGARGRRVVADVVLPASLVGSALHTTPQRMVEYWYGGALGGVMSGTTGVQGHFANGLAALYLACGQDVACVAESATGITRMETTAAGDLYASVTLPNIVVGTVGGGTALPSAKACLDILGLAGSGNAASLAEVCGGLVLAGEISIIAAFCSGDFAAAHKCLSREGRFARSNDHE